MKVIAVRMLLQGMFKREVRNQLGQHILSQSFDPCISLFHGTKAVNCDQAEYKKLSRRWVFNAEDQNFMSHTLIDQEPHLFLEKIQDKLYTKGGNMTSITTINIKLRTRLGLTLQKAAVSSAHKSFVAKAAFMTKYEHVPSEYLVFTGMSPVPSGVLSVHIGGFIH